MVKTKGQPKPPFLIKAPKGAPIKKNTKQEIESVNFYAKKHEVNDFGHKEVIQIQVGAILNKGDIMTYTSSLDSNLTRYIEIAEFLVNNGFSGEEENITGIAYNQYS